MILAVAIPSHANVRGCNRSHINNQYHNLTVTPIAQAGTIPFGRGVPSAPTSHNTADLKIPRNSLG